MQNSYITIINKLFKYCYLSWGVLFEMITSFALPCRSVLRVDLYPNVNFPLFITRARRELILSIAFFYKKKIYQDKITYFRPTWVAKEIDLPYSPLDKIYNPSRKIHKLWKLYRTLQWLIKASEMKNSISL